MEQLQNKHVLEVAELKKEKEAYKRLAEQHMTMSKQLAEEVIILRNQLDKFLHYKK